jgi:hypothetical protein
MRRDTSSWSSLLKAAGARRSWLSIVRWTSAMLRDGRVPEPEKITSSMPDARMFLCELSPITQRRASTRFDLPQPFGPTTPDSPGSIRKSVGSTKDLKPTTRRRVSFIGSIPHAPAHTSRRLAGRGGSEAG